MKLATKLDIEQCIYELLYAYYYIKETFTEQFEFEKSLAKWKVEIYDFIAQRSPEQLQYIQLKLKQEDSRVYLIVSQLITEVLSERNQEQQSIKPLTWKTKCRQFLGNISKYVQITFQKEESNEEVCVNSNIRHR